MRRMALLVMVLVAACAGTPSATKSPNPTASTEPSAGQSPIASPTAGPPSLVHCAVAVPAGDNLVIGTVVGDPTIVVRDIQDPANAHNLCRFDSAAQSPTFVSATRVAYETAGNEIVTADLGGGATTVLATYSTGFDAGQYAFSPDGRSVTYLDNNTWRLAGPVGNRVLATLPAAPGRGISPTEDDSFLAFSPDGLYIAYFQTFHVGGAGETAPDQIRRASDGKLVFSASGMTMAVWASVPSRLFFRGATGGIKRWDPAAGVTSMASVHWIRPRASPDGRWIAGAVRGSSGVGTVSLYSVQANSVSATTPAGRSSPRFLTNDLVWYSGERACSSCFGGQPTPSGVTYIYSIAGASEVTSRLASVIDAWPHTTAPAL